MFLKVKQKRFFTFLRQLELMSILECKVYDHLLVSVFARIHLKFLYKFSKLKKMKISDLSNTNGLHALLC